MRQLSEKRIREFIKVLRTHRKSQKEAYMPIIDGAIFTLEMILDGFEDGENNELGDLY